MKLFAVVAENGWFKIETARGRKVADGWVKPDGTIDGATCAEIAPTGHLIPGYRLTATQEHFVREAAKYRGQRAVQFED